MVITWRGRCIVRFRSLQSFGVTGALLSLVGEVLVILLCSAAAWHVATRGIPAIAIPRSATLQALVPPAAAIFLQVAVTAGVLIGMLHYQAGSMPVLAVIARRIATGERVDVPFVDHIDTVGDLARALRQWQDAMAIHDALLRGASVGVLLLDAGGVVQHANEAGQALLDRKASDLVGLELLRLVHPEDRASAGSLAPAWWVAADQGEAVVEIRLQRGDGGWQWCEAITATVGQRSETPDGLMVVLLDIGERKREAKMAAAIQHEMLPRGLPRMDGYDVVGVCRPARDVGSDLYDWMETGDGRLVLTLADVTGRGLGSALVMAELRTALRMAPEGSSPVARVRQVADTMTFGPADESLFARLFHAELEPVAGRVRYVDAGHGLCLVRRADGAVESLPVRSLPLGLGLGGEFREGEVWVQPGDTLLVCSDGLVEAQPGIGSLEQAVRDLAGTEEIVGALLQPVPEDRRADDLTLVVLSRTGGRREVPAPNVAGPAAPAAGQTAPEATRAGDEVPAVRQKAPRRSAIASLGRAAQAFFEQPPLVLGMLGLQVVAAVCVAAEWWIASDVSGHLALRGAALLAAAGWAVLASLPGNGVLLTVTLVSSHLSYVPMREQAATARAIAAGGHPEIAHSDRVDEIGDVARALREWHHAAAVREVLLRTAPIGILLLDGRGAIRDANRGAGRLLGCDPTTLRGERMIALLHPDDQYLAARLTPEAISAAGLGRATAEVRLRRADGAWRWCEGGVAVVGTTSGGPDGYVVTLRDIGDRRRETERAAAIQRQMLPGRAPLIDGYDLAGACRPAKDVAGDLFDWVETPDGYLDVTVADVMGKGMGPALVMASLRTALRMAPGLGPAERVGRAAETMTFGSEGQTLFVTLFHARLEVATGRFTYVDAGHGYCLVRRADGSLQKLGTRSLPLGIRLDVPFLEGEERLAPGDVLLLCSDGLVERDEETEHLEAVVSSALAGDEGAAEAVGLLLQRVPASAQSDDVTALVLRRLPAR